MRRTSAVVLLIWLWPALCAASVERFAVIVGNNAGASGDAPLQYAEADALRVYDVLHELGDFHPANMVLLRAESADTLRSTLISINDRIRSAQSLPDTQAVLFVYYSGHADVDALHLGHTRLAISEFAKLARGSAASFRLVVLDACRSGALTRTKGGRVMAPFPLPEERLPGDGVAFLTASSANEDAQESDELRGSFFTHALVSGLLGAADHDADGSIVLDEAYRYAYQATLRATSRTLSGAQHPSFRYDFRGQGEVVLTRPEAYAKQRANVILPAGMNVLLLRDNAEGPVVAELGERAAVRNLSLRPGRYFLRARAPDLLYEGEFDAAAGQVTRADLSRMSRIEYARLVRKGQSDARLAQAIEVGANLRSVLPNAEDACRGGFLGYGLDTRSFGARLQLHMCTSGFANQTLRATSNAYALDARVYRAWDVSVLSIELGLGAGASLFTQRFDAPGIAKARNTLAPLLVVAAAASLDLSRGAYARLELAGETHFLRLQRDATSDIEHTVSFALRAGLAFGKRF